MNLSKKVNRQFKACLNIFAGFFSTFLLLASSTSFSDDTELYVSESIEQAASRPKILIIFDTSGSMTRQDASFVQPYDNTRQYTPGPGSTVTSENYIYYIKDPGANSELPIPDRESENRRFADSINGCQTARGILSTLGVYSGKVRRYHNGDLKWKNLPTDNGSAIKVLDCHEDVTELNVNNGEHKDGTVLPDGYPVNFQSSNGLPVYYTASATDADSGSWGKLVTLYSANYLRWHHYHRVPAARSRMEVAKESVSNLINSAPGVDFGLQIFNRNGNGGRIVHGIQETTEDTQETTGGIEETTEGTKTELLNIVKGLHAKGSTPLTESLFETYQYLSGKPVWYGDDYINDGLDANPDRDEAIESGSNYEQPFDACDETIYVVMISDGEPTSDHQADGYMSNIPATGQETITSADSFSWTVNSSTHYSYLPALAGWMHRNDIHPTSAAGIQNAEVYTIGFGANIQAAAPVLAETATRGGGQYFPATDSASLTAALTNVLANINPTNNTLTSASVASNNFDRTETLDSVYYAMFEPTRRPRWQGNLKKYKVTNGIQKGSNGITAVLPSTGHFADNVQSYWSSSVDGDTVAKGGVAEMLTNSTARVIYSDLAVNNGLVALTYAAATKTANSSKYSTPAKLATILGVTNNEASIQASLDWINGRDVDDEDEDEDITENRQDVFGDPLHSKPVVINYGNDVIRIAVGTNHGVLHMFEDNDATNTIIENWAFMPSEFLSNIPILRDNLVTSDKVYGIDGVITSHIIDGNGNGIVDGDDKVWLFFGYRRGGGSYYAMDVTDPANPFVMWTIIGGADGTLGFSELGQTWSQPKVTYSKLNISGNAAKPVLLFGGGYIPSKDSHSIGGTGDADSKGKAIYMVDAEEGTLLWNLASDGDTVFSGSDSIPSSIATLDSDGDGLTDRLYAGDTGGNIWRIDMPGSDKTKFSVFKLAELGGDATNTVDRRFFNEPSIVRAYITETIDSGKKDSEGKAIVVQQDVPYDAVLLGSGDRSNPIGTDTGDVFFMIKDINIKTQQFTSASVPAVPTSPIKIGDLADFTLNPFGVELTSQEKEILSLAVSLKSGWFIELGGHGLGEKSTSTALVINNVVYFTTYTPAPSSSAGSSNTCDIATGSGWLYAVDLALGVNKYDWADESENSDDRKTLISDQFLGAPTLIVTKTLNPDTNTLESEGNIIVGREIIPVGFKLQTLRTYLYVTED
ncbi:rRNA (guanine-N1)-methyltransferase [Colwellia demingiae]|uniref:rRNA (Guanine-N1)-methyltransferase n=1 Tax=Colwellia demingiae TaxID=89401 RepID=A0A5C6QL96_9GAMM|nr:PilC/PilY family type IV pilus protein [Colwellia demingiae]TWX69755.1 rRNA (guanine-N1)-methyltransferase [Colwellia demingiae]